MAANQETLASLGNEQFSDFFSSVCRSFRNIQQIFSNGETDVVIFRMEQLISNVSRIGDILPSDNQENITVYERLLTDLKVEYMNSDWC